MRGKGSVLSGYYITHVTLQQKSKDGIPLGIFAYTMIVLGEPWFTVIVT